MHNTIFQKDTHYELNPVPNHLIAMHPNARLDTSIILKISFFFVFFFLIFFIIFLVGTAVATHHAQCSNIVIRTSELQ